MQYIFEGQRFEIEPVAGVIVGADRLRVAVDHDRLEAHLLQRETGVAAAVVKLDPLADAVGAAAQDDHLVTRGGRSLGFALVATVQIGRERGELGRARVHLMIGWQNAESMTQGADVGFGDLYPVTAGRRLTGRFIDNAGKLRIAESHPLGLPQCPLVQLARSFDGDLEAGDLLHLRHKPGIVNLRTFPQGRVVRLPVVLGPVTGNGTFPLRLQQPLEYGKEPVPGGDTQQVCGRGARRIALQLSITVAGQRPQPIAPDFKAAHTLLQRLLERAANGHHLADRFHLRSQLPVNAGELLKRPAGDLDHHIVDGRFERRHRLLRDVISEFIQPIADRQLCRQFCDWESGRLGCQRAGTGDARVHFNHHYPPRIRIDCKLNVAAAGLHTHRPHHQPGLVPQALVLFVGQGLRRGDGDAVAGVNAHGVEIFDGADNDEIVGAVAHHLQLILFPADQRLFDQDGMHRAFLQPPGHLFVELLRRKDGACAAATQGKTGANEDGEVPDHGRENLACFFERMGNAAEGRFQSGFGHRLLEQVAIFRHLHGAQIGADQFNAVAFEDALLRQGHRQVEAGLAAHGGQQRVRPLFGDDLLQQIDGKGFHVGSVSHLRVGHNCGRIGVDEHDPVPFCPQRLARLRARIVELTGLADDNRAGTDDQN